MLMLIQSMFKCSASTVNATMKDTSNLDSGQRRGMPVAHERIIIDYKSAVYYLEDEQLMINA